MARYFYKDPIAAAWMAKHFRMKLLAGKFTLQAESVDTFLRLLAEGMEIDTIVVQKESIPLLDPKVGDMVEDDGRGKLRILTEQHFPYTANLKQIVQRNGRAFIFPSQLKD
ncbi:hypothetical protein [Limnoglobus roseus]|uniref:Formylglycine-generating enzyme family protein n=1 Tax=Limnoglobus roseus TaxID=2598579 RepID=A0A5C1AEY8_9BACT|nr:hypothetical protein [Limnoglobus roseus]QEL16783.1 formylglycine-generating enzyme family protein [Limnoglobus roseus]